MNLELLLPLTERPGFTFEGDVDSLRGSLSVEFNALVDNLSQVKLIVITGHPGSGKSTLLRALSTIIDSPKFLAFHIDDYIDWGKVIPFVQNECAAERWDASYLPVANKAALSFLKESLKDEKLLIVEGSGLVTDYTLICKELKHPSPSFILLDGSIETFRKRLGERGDSLETKEKEVAEHKENLKNVKKITGLVINTDETNKEAPVRELECMFDFLKRTL